MSTIMTNEEYHLQVLGRPSKCEHCPSRDIWQTEHAAMRGTQHNAFRCVDCGKLTYCAAPTKISKND